MIVGSHFIEIENFSIEDIIFLLSKSDKDSIKQFFTNLPYYKNRAYGISLLSEIFKRDKTLFNTIKNDIFSLN